MAFLEAVNLVLLDIEGTITSISFVKDKLFGYVLENLAHYLDVKFDSELVQKDIKDILRESNSLENEECLQSINKKEIIHKVEKTVLQWMSVDKKCTSLKQFQGHMFEEAFKSGAIVTEFFPDVLSSINNLIKLGKQVSIYSSGSIFAQKLMFSHTIEGDITSSINGFYDTTIGSKTQVESYTKICELENVYPEQTLFLTDVLKEAEAAKNAGCKVGIMLREGNAQLAEQELEKFYNFKSMKELFNYI